MGVLYGVSFCIQPCDVKGDDCMNDMVNYFYSNGDLNLMLTKVLVYILVLFFLAVILGAIRKARL